MLKIRKAAKADLDEIIAMCVAHAAYEGVEINPIDFPKGDMSSLIFTKEQVICLVAENEFGLIGYATCAEQYSTWAASAYLYLDCLYVKQEARVQGIGTAFMKSIQQIMKAKKLTHVQWQTPQSNHLAISFYLKLGAKEFLKSRFIWTP